MKQIPDCPPNMGNANDWIKAREALGYPQNHTVSYEYTTYNNNNSDIIEEIERNLEKRREYGDDMFDMGFDEGYNAGYSQACIDMKECLKTNLSSSETIIRTLKRTNNYNPAENRFCKLISVLEIVKERLQNNLNNQQKKNKGKKS